ISEIVHTEDSFLLKLYYKFNFATEPIKETSKYSVKSSDFLTDDDERNQEIVNDLEKGLYRKRMLSYGGLLKQKHKILNLDDAEDGNLINTSDEDKTTDEEEKAHSITAIWNFEKQNYYLKNLKR
ncbi:protein rep, partial [Staphylococcus aureus]